METRQKAGDIQGNRRETVMDFKPSYANYRKILRDIKESGKYLDFSEAEKAEEYIVLRHDIEFSIDRAHALSLVEDDEGIKSTWFVQLTNNAYNPFSKKNLDLLKDMIARGHNIGLHFHLNGLNDEVSVRDGIRDEIRFLSEMLNHPVDRFSIHRPVKEVYYYKIHIKGIINAYSPQFFSYAENVTPETKLEVKYLCDSKHRWNYGYPDAEMFKAHKKIQILIHPFSWTEQGYDNYDNFTSLIHEKDMELINTLDMEFKRFAEIKDEIMNKIKR